MSVFFLRSLRFIVSNILVGLSRCLFNLLKRIAFLVDRRCCDRKKEKLGEEKDRRRRITGKDKRKAERTKSQV